MSDAPQTGPDLHAIFGMDTTTGRVEDPVVEIERSVATEDDIATEPLEERFAVSARPRRGDRLGGSPAG